MSLSRNQLAFGFLSLSSRRLQVANMDNVISMVPEKPITKGAPVFQLGFNTNTASIRW